MSEILYTFAQTNKMPMKFLYIAYQYLIALPLLIVLTIFTALFTIIFSPWRNARFVHLEQMFWSRSFFWLLFLPVKVTGLEHIQKGQSYVFVSNHQSMLDVWAIYGYLPVVYKWLMKAEIRKIPFVGTACKCAGHIFVERTNARSSFRSLQAMRLPPLPKNSYIVSISIPNPFRKSFLPCKFNKLLA